jgi:hypothetical protein
MPNIRDISLMLGRTSHSEEEFVRIAFNVDFSREEQSSTQGFLMHIILVHVNEGLDDFDINTHGITRKDEINGPDRIIGEIYRDIILPSGSTIRVDRNRAWEFGDLGNGLEEFRALIALIPRNWEFEPALVTSDPVKIDLG